MSEGVVSLMSDAELTQAVARRNEEAFGEIYRRHSAAVWGLARRVTNQAAEAEEVCQIVFVNLWSGAERFDPARGTLRSWLLAQTHGRAVDVIRSETSRRRRQLRVAQRAQPTVDGVDVVVATAVLADDVRRAVDQLPQGEREAIMLAYFGGRTYRETAQMLGQPEGTVKSRIRSGLKNLRHLLDMEGVTE